MLGKVGKHADDVLKVIARNPEYLEKMAAARKNPEALDAALGWVNEQAAASKIYSESQQHSMSQAKVLTDPASSKDAVMKALDDLSDSMLENCEDWICAWLQAAKKVRKAQVAQQELAAAENALAAKQKAGASREELERLEKEVELKKEEYAKAQEEAKESIKECEVPEEQDDSRNSPTDDEIKMLLAIGAMALLFFCIFYCNWRYKFCDRLRGRTPSAAMPDASP